MTQPDKIPNTNPLAEIGSAFVFLSRLPVPQALFKHGYPDLRDCLWAFPVVGAALGLITALTGRVVTSFDVPSLVVVVMMLITMTMLTGGLHEDGLADMADGFGVHKEPSEIARIMKDSVIGSYGTLSLILLFLLRFATISSVSMSDLWLLLPAAMAMGRFFVLIALRTTPLSPYASLGKLVSKPSMPTIFAGGLFTFAACVFLPMGAILAGLFACLSAFVFIRALAIRKIGGLTGDVMGALIAIMEMSFMIGYLSYV